MKSDEEKASLDFLLYCVFGTVTFDSVDSAINRAYIDMASHTMKSFDDIEEKWGCRYDASMVLKTFLEHLGEKEFDDWHKEICNKLKDIYQGERLSYGQAQKWVNMTIKYIYVLKCLGVLNQSCVPYISEENVNKFHPPIDSYVLSVLGDKKTSWSTMEEVEYVQKIAELRKKKFGFVKELYEWNRLSVDRKYDSKDSYAYYLHKKWDETKK